MNVFLSRFTPGLKNGEGVDFKIGETVIYGKNKVAIIIDSELMAHSDAPGDGTGYEAIFSDTGERAFASEVGIIDWVDKGIWKEELEQ
jgi:hypothetical protein